MLSVEIGWVRVRVKRACRNFWEDSNRSSQPVENIRTIRTCDSIGGRIRRCAIPGAGVAVVDDREAPRVREPFDIAFDPQLCECERTMRVRIGASYARIYPSKEERTHTRVDLCTDAYPRARVVATWLSVGVEKS